VFAFTVANFWKFGNCCSIRLKLRHLQLTTFGKLSTVVQSELNCGIYSWQLLESCQLLFNRSWIAAFTVDNFWKVVNCGSIRVELRHLQLTTFGKLSTVVQSEVNCGIYSCQLLESCQLLFYQSWIAAFTVANFWKVVNCCSIRLKLRHLQLTTFRKLSTVVQSDWNCGIYSWQLLESCQLWFNQRWIAAFTVANFWKGVNCGSIRGELRHLQLPTFGKLSTVVLSEWNCGIYSCQLLESCQLLFNRSGIAAFTVANFWRVVNCWAPST
jgi:hypothetical protein